MHPLAITQFGVINYLLSLVIFMAFMISGTCIIAALFEGLAVIWKQVRNG